VTAAFPDCPLRPRLREYSAWPAQIDGGSDGRRARAERARRSLRSVASSGQCGALGIPRTRIDTRTTDHARWLGDARACPALARAVPALIALRPGHRLD